MIREKRLSLILALIFVIAGSAAQTPAASIQSATSAQINIRDYNVLVLSDERVLVITAALNLAGYDFEPGGKLTDLRLQLREDLKGTDPELLARLRNYYRSHRIPGREEVAQLSPYIGLALALSEPPAFATPTLADKLPPDVRAVLDFTDLLREFYRRSAIRELLPKYKPIFEKLQTEYQRAAAIVLYETLSYLHTQPVLYLPPTPVFSPDEISDSTAASDNKEKKKEKEEKKDEKSATPTLLSQPRMRRLLIFLNPFASAGSVFQRNDILNGTDINVPRRLGDDYTIVASEQSLTEHIRHGFLRFVLDPIVGKSSVEIANLKQQVDTLLTALPQAKEKARRNVYEVVGESLALAVGVRLTALAAQGSFTADDASYVLSQHYEQGAVLVFHFYEGLQGLERVGIDIREFVAPFLAKIDFAREAKRLEETRAARARVEQRRAAVKPIIDVDDLIKQRRYDEAKTQLEAILKQQPQNARALFALAQITNTQPSTVELNQASPDDEKIAAQEERLANAIKLYREAIAAANANEKGLISQCHVYIGRILDFVEQREAAVVEYEEAIKLGDVPNGAYREALEGKARPYQGR
ncbi:MAG: hypothetical protein AB1489_16335 [Acidobacteriota bacterium]